MASFVLLSLALGFSKCRILTMWEFLLYPPVTSDLRLYSGRQILFIPIAFCSPFPGTSRCLWTVPGRELMPPGALLNKSMAVGTQFGLSSVGEIMLRNLLEGSEWDWASFSHSSNPHINTILLTFLPFISHLLTPSLCSWRSSSRYSTCVLIFALAPAFEGCELRNAHCGVNISMYRSSKYL